MINVFRIVKKKYESTAFSGTGSQNVTGRWHTKGKLVVYTSMSASLAALEVLVHWQPIFNSQAFVLCCATIPKSCVDSKYKSIDLSDPANGQTSTQGHGDQWISSSSTLALEVPSVIISSEFNYIINPMHPDFNKLTIITTKDFSFDQRLIV
jgi:RES domain-containing protein